MFLRDSITHGAIIITDLHIQFFKVFYNLGLFNFPRLFLPFVMHAIHTSIKKVGNATARKNYDVIDTSQDTSRKVLNCGPSNTP